MTTYIKCSFIICLLHLLRIVYHDNVVKLLLIIAVYGTMFTSVVSLFVLVLVLYKESNIYCTQIFDTNAPS